MTAKSKLQRMDNVLIVVEDLEAAKAFFIELGMELEGETTVEGPWVDSVVGLKGVRADITMMRTPDGHNRVELTKFHSPPAVKAQPEKAPSNTLGIRRIMFTVEDIDDVVARLRTHGAELVGDIAQYEDFYRLCFLRCPESIIIGLAEKLSASPKGGTEITLWHLATHTSGLRRLPGNLMTSRMDPKNPYAHYTTEDLYEGLKTSRLASKPGKLSSYSNFGMGLLGHVLSRVAGKDYQQLVKSRICDPLGMVDTTVSLSAEQQSRLAPGHAKGKRTANWDIVTLAGAGGLRSTGTDMLRFLRAQCDLESSPLRDAMAMTQKHQTGWNTIGQWIALGVMFLPFTMWSLQRAIFDWIGTVGLAALPKWKYIVLFGLFMLSVVAYIFYVVRPLLGRMTRLGLAWHFGDLPSKGEHLWHNGATGGYCSYMAVVPGKRMGVVMLSNCNKSVDGIGLKALAAVTTR